METLEIHLNRSKAYFGGFNQDLKKSKFIIFGAPIDLTSTYRPGSRFAPSAIREAAANIETFSFRAELDAEEVMIYDAGDLNLGGNLNDNIEKIGEIVVSIIKINKTPIVIGGEHIITYGPAKNLGNVGLISFDAHLDLRNEYPPNVKWSHATVMRRISEKIGASKMYFIGTRAICREEYEYAKCNGIQYITSREILNEKTDKTIAKISNQLRRKGILRAWMTIDMDVLDPAYAPGVGNPEPEGITAKQLIDIIEGIIRSGIDIVGFDVVEVNPIFDNGITAIHAAKVILETSCLLYKAKLLDA